MESPEEIFRPLSKRIQLLVACWMAASAALMLALWSYEVRAGELAAIHSQLPQAYATNRSEPKLNGLLFVFVHPMCRCTVATLEELEQLLTDLPAARRPAVRVVVLQPPKTGPFPETGPLPKTGERWECAQAEMLSQRFDQAAVLYDEGGQIAREFGAKTSGQIVLYGIDGELLFDGGITLSRGHRGPAAGQELLRNCLLTGDQADQTIPVFGCALSTPE